MQGIYMLYDVTCCKNAATLCYSGSVIYIQIYVNVEQSKSNCGFTIPKAERAADREEDGIITQCRKCRGLLTSMSRVLIQKLTVVLERQVNLFGNLVAVADWAG